MAGGVEAVSRGTDLADLDRKSRRLERRKSSSRQFKRLESDVGWKQDLLLVRPKRSGEPLLLRRSNEEGDRDDPQQRSRHQIGIGGTGRYRLRAVWLAQPLRPRIKTDAQAE